MKRESQMLSRRPAVRKVYRDTVSNLREVAEGPGSTATCRNCGASGETSADAMIPAPSLNRSDGGSNPTARRPPTNYGATPMNNNEVGFLTVEELADLCHVRPRTIYDWIARDAVPYRKVGRRALFPLGEIQRWLDQRGLRLEQIP